MLDTYVRAKIDSETKEQAVETLKAMGISISDYLRMAIIQLANKKAIPFDIIEPHIIHIPNKLTVATMNKTQNNEEINHVDTTDALFKELNI